MKGVIKQKKVIWKQTNIVIPIPKAKIKDAISKHSLKISNFVVKYSITTQIKKTAAPKNQKPNIKR